MKIMLVDDDDYTCRIYRQELTQIVFLAFFLIILKAVNSHFKSSLDTPFTP